MTTAVERGSEGESESLEDRGPASCAEREPGAVVVACPDGPLLVRGDFEILSPDGAPLPRTRRTVALCRCGASALKPFCDGSHKVIGFRTEPVASAEDAGA